MTAGYINASPISRATKLSDPVARPHRGQGHLVYASAYTENGHGRSRIADATATLMDAKAVVEPVGR